MIAAELLPVEPEPESDEQSNNSPSEALGRQVASGTRLELSVVTSALNEVDNVLPFLEESVSALDQLAIEWEIIYIDDGSSDGTGDSVLEYAAQIETNRIRLIRHSRCQGITAAIEQSVNASRGKFVCLLPADMECSPKTDIPALYAAVDEQTDVVVGRRLGRADGKSFASGVYNRINRYLFNVHLHDANWIKLYRREKALGIYLRSEWHRFFIPILASRGCRIKEVGVTWHPRKFGKSNFGLSRFPVSLADMLAVKLLITYSTRPLLFFGWLSCIMCTLAIAALGVSLTAPEGSDHQWFGGLIVSVGAFMTAVINLSVGACAELLLGMKGIRDDDISPS
ncbi:MAG: glycosyltransferase involved in cell wall biosynthesis [Lentisphaeria bacterium]|jgi:glycosyltransferase involved in cell wall biosynthesis